MASRQPAQLVGPAIIVGQSTPQRPATTPSGSQADAEEAVASHGMPSEAPTPEPDMDEVNQYLWGVYERSQIKRDRSGDFTWKDIAAAAHLGMTLGDYVIVGMDRDFRELLYRAGRAMDAAGIRWTILSGFRDDYRQGLAAGYKAHTGDSLHGGSITTGGYGHGCAVDIADADGGSPSLLTWLDANKLLMNLERPLPGIDPAHVQARGAWHEVAASLRNDRLAGGKPSENAAPAAPSDLADAPPSDADLRCIGLHHHRPDPLQAEAPPEHQIVKVTARAHVVGKLPSREVKAASKSGVRAAESSRLPLHPKGPVRPLPRHAVHVLPRSAGTT